MNRERFSALAHGDMPIWNPIGAERLNAFIARLELPQQARVLDIGCGRGDLLRRIAEHYPDACAVGIDPSPFANNLARQAASGSPAQARLKFLEQGYNAPDIEASSKDLVLVIGSSHAIGDYQQALQEAQRVLKPGGQLLIAEGYWQQRPCADYMAFLGETEEGASITHQGNIDTACQTGFEVLDSLETGLAEWDDYENSYAANMLRYLDANPRDPDAEAMRERITTWHNGYLRWGRHTMGFALYWLRKPLG